MGDASNLNKMVDGVHGKLGGLTGTLGKVAGAFAALSVVKQVGDYFVEAGKAAAEEDQQMQQLSKALQDNAGVTKAQYGEVEKWIAATQRATATADGELRPALLKLSSTTKDVGQAQDILSTALDISKARGLDLNTVVVAMEKGYAGNVGGLQRLGIATKDAEGNTLSFEQVMKNANETYGGAAQEAANTTAGRMQNLSLTLADLKETVGMALLPVIEKFTGFIMDNMPTIEKVMVGFADLVGAALNVLSELVFPILQTVFEAFTGSVEGKIPGTNKLFDSLGIVAEALKGVFAVVMPAIQQLIKAVIDFFAGPTGQALMKGLMEALGAALNVLKSVFERVWPIIMGAIRAVIDWFNGPQGQKLMTFLFDGIKAALGLVQKAFETVWPLASAALKTAWAIAKPILDVMMKAIDGVTWAIDKLKDAWNWLKGGGGIEKIEYYSNMAKSLNAAAAGKLDKYGNAAYASGGPIPGSGPVPITAHGGEYVLNRTDMSELGKMLAGGLKGGGGMGNVTIYIQGQGYAAGQAAADGFLDRCALAGVRL